MNNYKETIQELTNSIMSFTYEFDFEEVKKELELKEVPKNELEQLGEIGIKQKFDTNIGSISKVVFMQIF